MLARNKKEVMIYDATRFLLLTCM